MLAYGAAARAAEALGFGWSSIEKSNDPLHRQSVDKKRRNSVEQVRGRHTMQPKKSKRIPILKESHLLLKNDPRRVESTAFEAAVPSDPERQARKLEQKKRFSWWQKSVDS